MFSTRHIVFLVAACFMDVCTAGDVKLTMPKVALSGVTFNVEVTLPPFTSNTATIPQLVHYNISEKGEVLRCRDDNCSVSVWGNNRTELSFTIVTEVHSIGHHTLVFQFSNESDGETFCSQDLRFLAIYPVLTLIPPIATAIIAILCRQVLLALLIGIWMCAFFANEYNPGTAILRTLDTYFVESIATPSHAAIIVGAFFLGGLIGVVQKSGGGIGLAKMLNRFAGSRRKTCILCMVLCFIIFFDDYSCVLIPGVSLRSVMDSVGVSKEKFAFIIQSIAPILPSLMPVSSWIGVEIGYVGSAFGQCEDYSESDAFLIVLKSIPYRFFPLLVLLNVVVVCVGGRDFGPMLTVERQSGFPLEIEEQESSEVELSSPNGHSEDNDGFTGPLAPKPGVPYRWFNAAVPFLLTIVATLLGMVFSGRNVAMNKHESLSLVNIFTYADAISALIWGSALGCLVLMVMLLIQRILTLREYMESWMEGLKDIIEALIILILAWAFGAAIEDIQTSNFIAQLLNSWDLPPTYLPSLISLLGFFMSFATGSAFGTMGILFPLLIPSLCKIPGVTKDTLVQAAAAILGSALFGNVISPMADITVLTIAATRCNLTSHLKTAFPYVILIGLVSVLFGSLPVGASWYPWYVGWGAMAIAQIGVFVLFSTSPTSSTSKALCMRGCPCLYTFPATVIKTVQKRVRRAFQRQQQDNIDQQSLTSTDGEIDEVSPLLPARQVKDCKQ